MASSAAFKSVLGKKGPYSSGQHVQSVIETQTVKTVLGICAVIINPWGWLLVVSYGKAAKKKRFIEKLVTLFTFEFSLY